VLVLLAGFALQVFGFGSAHKRSLVVSCVVRCGWGHRFFGWAVADGRRPKCKPMFTPFSVSTCDYNRGHFRSFLPVAGALRLYWKLAIVRFGKRAFAVRGRREGGRGGVRE
jgi:hypothetical protein